MSPCCDPKLTHTQAALMWPWSHEILSIQLSLSKSLNPVSEFFSSYQSRLSVFAYHISLDSVALSFFFFVLCGKFFPSLIPTFGFDLLEVEGFCEAFSTCCAYPRSSLTSFFFILLCDAEMSENDFSRPSCSFCFCVLDKKKVQTVHMFWFRHISRNVFFRFQHVTALLLACGFLFYFYNSI